MRYFAYEPTRKPPYREIDEIEYTMLLLTGEWQERGEPCIASGCLTCGGDGMNKTLMNKTLMRIR